MNFKIRCSCERFPSFEKINKSLDFFTKKKKLLSAQTLKMEIIRRVNINKKNTTDWLNKSNGCKRCAIKLQDVQTEKYLNFAVVEVAWSNSCTTKHLLCFNCVIECQQYLFCPFGCEKIDQIGTCKRWMLNKPCHSELCPYGHSESLKGNYFKFLDSKNPKKIVCISFLLRGSCNKKYCKLHHPSKLSECGYFALGKCNVFPCKYLHPTSEENAYCAQCVLTGHCNTFYCLKIKSIKD